MRLSRDQKIRHAEEVCRHAKYLAVELEGAVIELNSLHEQFGLEKAEDTIASMDWMKDQINSFKEHTNQWAPCSMTTSSMIEKGYNKFVGDAVKMSKTEIFTRIGLGIIVTFLLGWMVWGVVSAPSYMWN